MIKDDLRPDARIRATDHGRERPMALAQRTAGFRDLFGATMVKCPEAKGAFPCIKFKRFDRDLILMFRRQKKCRGLSKARAATAGG